MILRRGWPGKWNLNSPNPIFSVTAIYILWIWISCNLIGLDEKKHTPRTIYVDWTRQPLTISTTSKWSEKVYISPRQIGAIIKSVTSRKKFAIWLKLSFNLFFILENGMGQGVLDVGRGFPHISSSLSCMRYLYLHNVDWNEYIQATKSEMLFLLWRPKN